VQNIEEIGDSCTRLRRGAALAGRGIAWLQYHRYARPDLAFTRLPMPWAALVIRLRDTDQWRRPDGDWRSAPRLALRGPAAVRTEGRDAFESTNEYVSALLEPWAIPSLFGVPASAIRDNVVDLEELWAGTARRLLDRMAEARDPEAKLDLLGETLLAQPDRRSCDPRAARFMRACRTRAGGGTLERLSEGSGLSARRFRQVFEGAVGLSPKRWARLERFCATVRELHPSSWGTRDDFTPPDYCDQAHAIREFRRHAGMTPHAYGLQKASGDPRVFVVTEQLEAARGDTSRGPTSSEAIGAGRLR
jgi:AraC-like DNA-binding protein